MKTNRWAVLFSLCAILTMFSVGPAEAANGTLTVTFKYKDPATQVDQNLNYAFIYLHDATKPAPMEKFLSKADYILGGPTSTVNGKITVPVPAGKYYIRVLQRKVLGGATRPYGPPEGGDLTWFQTSPVTIVAGATLDLGTRYATPFGTAITITGTVKDHNGTPLVGRYVRATTEPCYEAGYDWGSNQCGPVKFMALNPIDADGKFTLYLRDAGNYFLSLLYSWDTTIGCSGYCAPQIIGTGTQPLPVSVQMGEAKNLDWVPW